MARGENQIPEALTDTPLSAEDVVAVGHDIKSFAKDRSRIEHFVRRSYATARALTDLKHNFETELATRSKAVPAGTPSNMSPEQAARFLSPDQLTRLFDRFMQDKLAIVESQRRNAEADSRQVDAVITTLRGAIAELMQDPSVPAHVRQRFAHALDQAVAAAAQLPHRAQGGQGTNHPQMPAAFSVPDPQH